MKKVLYYYTYTGNGEVVAKHFEELGYEIRLIKRKKKMPKSFFWSVMSGGFLAGIKHKDKLVDFNEDIKDYDEVVIGSPIWNARFASPTNTALKKLGLENLNSKKLTFVLYSGSGEAKKAVKRIQKEYPNATIILLKEPKKYPEELEKLKDIK